MKLNLKISSLLIIGFAAVSIGLTFSSVLTLKKNQDSNIQLFKAEFLEVSRGAFEDNSSYFFSSIEEKINISTSSSELISSIEKIDPEDVWIYSIPLKKYLFGPNNTATNDLINNEVLQKYQQENTLNLKKIFDIDNFKEYISNTKGKIFPIKIQSRIYRDNGIIIGYTKSFPAVKLRIEFIQRQSQQFFQSYVMSSAVTVAATLVVSITIMIFLMQSVVLNPLKEISLGLERVKKGVLNTKIHIKNKDEIGQIASVFNDMTQDLEISKNKIDEYNATLEQKIEERTNLLNSKLKELEITNKLMVDRELKMIDLKKQIQDLEKNKNV